MSADGLTPLPETAPLLTRKTRSAEATRCVGQDARGRSHQHHGGRPVTIHRRQAQYPFRADDWNRTRIVSLGKAQTKLPEQAQTRLIRSHSIQVTTAGYHAGVHRNLCGEQSPR